MSPLLKTSGLLLFLMAGLAFGSTATAPEDALRRASKQLFDSFRIEQKQLKKDPARVYDLVNDSLAPFVDFPLVSQLVLGKHWRGASAAQRSRFTTEFHTLLVRFYTAAFVDDPSKVDEVLAYSDSLIRFAPAKINPDGVRARVEAKVHLPDGRVVPVNFALHHKGADWKIYDVSVEGISLVTNYRTSFSSEIRQGGLDRLIERLAARNREFLAQAKAR